MLRDNAIAAGGLLFENIGGPPVKPYQPDGLWEEKSGLAYDRDRGPGSHRRSLYTFWKRTSPPPAMLTFDATTREFCAVKRQTTATPLQALVLLNDPQFVEAARALAQRSFREGGLSLDSRITFAFRTLTGRYPHPRNSSRSRLSIATRSRNTAVANPTRKNYSQSAMPPAIPQSTRSMRAMTVCRRLF